jgi:hypothetical protein
MVSEDPPILPKGDNKTTVTKQDDVLNEISKILNNWGIIAAILRVIHVLLIIIATVSSVYVAAALGSTNLGSTNLPAENTNAIALAALIGAISAALFAGLDLGSKSNNTRTAWRRLNTAVMKYRAGHIDIKELIECYEKGEDLIGDVKTSLNG